MAVTHVAVAIPQLVVQRKPVQVAHTMGCIVVMTQCSTQLMAATHAVVKMELFLVLRKHVQVFTVLLSGIALLNKILLRCINVTPMDV
jgi:hypothetical protein